MSIDERIKIAEEKREEAFKINSMHFIDYWDGYIAALKETKESENEQTESV